MGINLQGLSPPAPKGLEKPMRREHRTKEGETYSLEDIAPSNPSGGVLIYLEEPERREGFEGPYYAISSLD